MLERNLISPSRSRARRLHRHLTDARLNSTLQPITVAHHSLSFALVLQLQMPLDELRHLGFHCLLQQLPRPVPQNLGQQVRHRQRDSWILVFN
jgi:hypothetical protein